MNALMVLEWMEKRPRCRVLLRMRMRMRMLLLVVATCMWRIPCGAEAAAMKVDWSSCGAPLTRPDVNCCTLPELMEPGGPRAYKEWEQYVRESPLRRKVRPAAHLVARNATYVAQLHRAFQLMRELPSTDPRSMVQQVNMHCMYGSAGTGIVMQLPPATALGSAPTREYTVHRNWLWLPFHRWITFFFERILAKLVEDDQFALPFWNWDNQSEDLSQDGQTFLPGVVPRFYRDPDKYPALYNAKRHPKHGPGNPDSLVDLSSGYNQSVDHPGAIRKLNNQRLHDYIVGTTEGEEGRIRFMSHPFSAGDDPVEVIVNDDSKIFTFEYQIHGVLHAWIGDPAFDREDFGHIWTAVNDALFMAHHPNVDRMWAVWQSLGGKEFDHPDFLDAAFFFYDENAELVRVTVRDALDHRKLMLDWQEVDNPWVSPQFATSSPDAVLRSSS